MNLSGIVVLTTPLFQLIENEIITIRQVATDELWDIKIFSAQKNLSLPLKKESLVILLPILKQ
jgi:hypothetical protein